MTTSNIACLALGFPLTSTPPPPTALAPVISPAAGTYASFPAVTIIDLTFGALIYYTTDGSTPSPTHGTLYSGPFTPTGTSPLTVKAMAAAAGYLNSSVSAAAYTLGVPTVATPVITPTTGTYGSIPAVTITEATTGAAVYYTTDGSTPSPTHGTLYSGPFTPAGTSPITVKAIGTKTGYNNSSVAQVTYTISIPVLPTPVISPSSGTFASPPTVTITDAMGGGTLTTAAGLQSYLVSLKGNGLLLGQHADMPGTNTNHQGVTASWTPPTGQYDVITGIEAATTPSLDPAVLVVHVGFITGGAYVGADGYNSLSLAQYWLGRGGIVWVSLSPGNPTYGNFIDPGDWGGGATTGIRTAGGAAGPGNVNLHDLFAQTSNPTYNNWVAGMERVLTFFRSLDGPCICRVYEEYNRSGPQWWAAINGAATGVATGCSISGTTITVGTVTSGAFTPGWFVTGTGIPANTKIITVSGSTVTVNNACTTEASVTVTQPVMAASQLAQLWAMTTAYVARGGDSGVPVTNVLWALNFSSGHSTAATDFTAIYNDATYPGSAWIDIFSIDHYPPDGTPKYPGDPYGGDGIGDNSTQNGFLINAFLAANPNTPIMYAETSAVEGAVINSFVESTETNVLTRIKTQHPQVVGFNAWCWWQAIWQQNDIGLLMNDPYGITLQELPQGGGTIYYTENGTTPSPTNGTVYTAPFVAAGASPIKVQAIAVKPGYTDSAVAAQTYTISAPSGTAIRVVGSNLAIVTSGVSTPYVAQGFNFSNLEDQAVQQQPPWGTGGVPKWSYAGTWNANIARIPLNANSWLGLSCYTVSTDGTYWSAGPNPAAGPDGKAAYQAAVIAAVVAAQAQGFVVILDLHWSGCKLTLPYGSAGGVSTEGYVLPLYQPAFANTDTDEDFWYAASDSIAAIFGTQATPQPGVNNALVMFELFNEPAIDQLGGVYGNNTLTAGKMLNGGTITSWFTNYATTPVAQSWTALGYQTMVNGIRALGAQNILWCGGIGYSHALSLFRDYMPTEPAGFPLAPQLGCTQHLYPYAANHAGETADPFPRVDPDPNSGNTNWSGPAAAVIAAGYPLLWTEVGGFYAAAYTTEPFVTNTWARGKSIGVAGFIAWTFWEGYPGQAANGSAGSNFVDYQNNTPTGGQGTVLYALMNP